MKMYKYTSEFHHRLFQHQHHLLQVDPSEILKSLTQRKFLALNN